MNFVIAILLLCFSHNAASGAIIDFCVHKIQNDGSQLLIACSNNNNNNNALFLDSQDQIALICRIQSQDSDLKHLNSTAQLIKNSSPYLPRAKPTVLDEQLFKSNVTLESTFNGSIELYKSAYVCQLCPQGIIRTNHGDVCPNNTESELRLMFRDLAPPVPRTDFHPTDHCSLHYMLGSDEWNFTFALIVTPQQQVSNHWAAFDYYGEKLNMFKLSLDEAANPTFNFSNTRCGFVADGKFLYQQSDQIDEKNSLGCEVRLRVANVSDLRNTKLKLALKWLQQNLPGYEIRRSFEGEFNALRCLRLGTPSAHLTAQEDCVDHDAMTGINITSYSNTYPALKSRLTLRNLEYDVTCRAQGKIISSSVTNQSFISVKLQENGGSKCTCEVRAHAVLSAAEVMGPSSMWTEDAWSDPFALLIRIPYSRPRRNPQIIAHETQIKDGFRTARVWFEGVPKSEPTQKLMLRVYRVENEQWKMHGPIEHLTEFSLTRSHFSVPVGGLRTNSSYALVFSVRNSCGDNIEVSPPAVIILEKLKNDERDENRERSGLRWWIIESEGNNATFVVDFTRTSLSSVRADKCFRFVVGVRDKRQNEWRVPVSRQNASGSSVIWFSVNRTLLSSFDQLMLGIRAINQCLPINQRLDSGSLPFRSLSMSLELEPPMQTCAYVSASALSSQTVISHVENDFSDFQVKQVPGNRVAFSLPSFSCSYGAATTRRLWYDRIWIFEAVRSQALGFDPQKTIDDQTVYINKMQRNEIDRIDDAHEKSIERGTASCWCVIAESGGALLPCKLVCLDRATITAGWIIAVCIVAGLVAVAVVLLVLFRLLVRQRKRIRKADSAFEAHASETKGYMTEATMRLITYVISGVNRPTGRPSRPFRPAPNRLKRLEDGLAQQPSQTVNLVEQTNESGISSANTYRSGDDYQVAEIVIQNGRGESSNQTDGSSVTGVSSELRSTSLRRSRPPSQAGSMFRDLPCSGSNDDDSSDDDSSSSESSSEDEEESSSESSENTDDSSSSATNDTQSSTSSSS